MASTGEAETSAESLNKLLVKCFGDEMLFYLEKHRMLLFELPDYDSRYDEDNAGWESAVASLNDIVGRLNLTYPLEVHTPSSTDEESRFIDSTANIGADLMNLCCWLLPIEFDDEGDSRIFLKVDDEAVTCKLVLEGEFSNWVITDPRDEERTIDDGMDLKVRIRLELTKREDEE